LICCEAFALVRSDISGSSTLNGFLVGAGIEHALTRNWTVKFEYNYVDFGSLFLNLHVTPGNQPINVDQSLTRQTFKVGANYLFDFGGAPLVAKY
jgi:outer membrane immunogenic protein